MNYLLIKSFKDLKINIKNTSKNIIFSFKKVPSKLA